MHFPVSQSEHSWLARIVNLDYFVSEPMGELLFLSADAEPFSSAFVVEVPEALESREGAVAD